MTILVGYIPTPQGEAALAAAIAEAKAHDESVLVINMSRDDKLVDAHRADSSDLDRLDADLAESGVAHEVRRIEHGTDPADQILEVIDRERPGCSSSASDTGVRSASCCWARRRSACCSTPPARSSPSRQTEPPAYAPSPTSSGHSSTDQHVEWSLQYGPARRVVSSVRTSTSSGHSSTHQHVEWPSSTDQHVEWSLRYGPK